MIHVKQTKFFEPGPPVYRGNCVAANIASLFEVPLESIPELGGTSSGVNEWLRFRFPGVTAQHREYAPYEVPEDGPDRGYGVQGYWLATVESPRFTEECRYHVSGKGKPTPPFWWRKKDCPHCGGSGERPGYHSIICRGLEVVHDPHPDSPGYGWEYVGRLCGETWFQVTDPARLVPRALPA